MLWEEMMGMIFYGLLACVLLLVGSLIYLAKGTLDGVVIMIFGLWFLIITLGFLVIDKTDSISKR